MELTVLRHTYLLVRSRLYAARTDERGSTLEIVLWIAGLATLALATIAFVVIQVGKAQKNIPTGP